MRIRIINEEGRTRLGSGTAGRERPGTSAASDSDLPEGGAVGQGAEVLLVRAAQARRWVGGAPRSWDLQAKAEGAAPRGIRPSPSRSHASWSTTGSRQPKTHPVAISVPLWIDPLAQVLDKTDPVGPCVPARLPTLLCITSGPSGNSASWCAPFPFWGGLKSKKSGLNSKYLYFLEAPGHKGFHSCVVRF